MRLQADITTAWLDGQRGTSYHIDGERLTLPDTLARLTLRSVRVAVFSDRSTIVPLDRSLEALACASALGLEVVLCLHCSDDWADPSHQLLPYGWRFRDSAGLRRAFATYLTDVLIRAAITGARIRRIQIGNEVTNGFLWPFGRTWDGFADLYAMAAVVVRRHLPEAQLILHTDLGGGGEETARWYAEAARRRLPFDAIGLSYYPMWHGDFDRLAVTLDHLSSRFQQPVIIAETGYMNTGIKTSAWFGDWTAGGIAYGAEGQVAFLERLAALVDTSDDRVCRDVFWWGAFAHRTQAHFPVAWFDRTGQALPILKYAVQARETR